MLQFISIQRKDNQEWAIPGVGSLISELPGYNLKLAVIFNALLQFFFFLSQVKTKYIVYEGFLFIFFFTSQN